MANSKNAYKMPALKVTSATVPGDPGEYNFRDIVEIPSSTLTKFSRFSTEYSKVKRSKDIEYSFEIRRDYNQSRDQPNVAVILKLRYPDGWKIEATCHLAIPPTSFLTSLNQSFGRSASIKPKCSLFFEQLLDVSTRTGAVKLDIDVRLWVQRNAPRSPMIEYDNVVRMDTNIDADLNILVDRQLIKVHRRIILPNFPKLEPLIDDKTKKLKIDLFSFTAVQVVIFQCYGQDIDSLTLEDVIGVWKFSDTFGSNKLKAKIEALFYKKLNDHTCVDFANSLLKFNIPQLNKICFDYLLKARSVNNPIIKFEGLDKSILKKIHDFCFS